MAKYYPDIAKGAKGKETLFFDIAFFFARRSIGFDLSLLFVDTPLTTNVMLSTHHRAQNRLTHRQPDVRKQILAGRETDRRRGAHVVFEQRFSLPTYTFTRASRTLDERKRSKNQSFPMSVQRRSPRMKEEKLTFDVFFYRIEREQQ